MTMRYGYWAIVGQSGPVYYSLALTTVDQLCTVIAQSVEHHRSGLQLQMGLSS